MNFFSGGNKFDETQCKTNLKLAVTRLGLQKTKKENMTKNLKREIADLLRVGKVESARIKVESVIREDFIVEAYEILELFCQLILSRLGVIQVAKECPADLKEAVCTLIYAAPRAEVKELQVIRQQLFYKFGKEFANEAIMNKDNCVNARVIHKLAVQTPENYMVYNYLNEVAKSYGVDWQSDIVAPEPSSQSPNHNHHHHHDEEPTFSFPDVPTSSSSTSKNPTFSSTSTPLPPPSSTTSFDLQFPSAPKSFPSSSTTTTMIPPPVVHNNNTATLNFPSVPEPDIPTFNPHDLPGFNFPTPPSFGTSNNPNINTNTSMNHPSSIDHFSFPSVPSSTSTPSASSKNTMNFDDLFPPTPSSSNNNPNSSSGGAPDFDELTARFERLKKRDA